MGRGARAVVAMGEGGGEEASVGKGEGEEAGAASGARGTGRGAEISTWILVEHTHKETHGCDDRCMYPAFRLPPSRAVARGWGRRYLAPSWGRRGRGRVLVLLREGEEEGRRRRGTGIWGMLGIWRGGWRDWNEWNEWNDWNEWNEWRRWPMKTDWPVKSKL